MATTYNNSVVTDDIGVIKGIGFASPSPTIEPLDPVPFAYRLVLYVFGTPLVVLNFVGNFLFIALVMKYPRMKSRVTVLALSWIGLDFLAGLVLIIQMTVVQVQWSIKDSPALCLLWVSLQIAPLLISSSHMAVLSVDRYISIKFPLQYQDSMSYKRLKIYLICIWGYSTLLSCVPFLWHDGHRNEQAQCSIFVLQRYYNLLYIFLHLVPIICLCVTLYVRILIHTRRHERQVHVTNTITQEQFLAEKTLCNVFLTVTILFIITWLPFIICSMVRIGTPHISQTLQMALLCTWLLGYSNNASKMFVYYALHADMRQCIKEAVGPEKIQVRRGSALPSMG